MNSFTPRGGRWSLALALVALAACADEPVGVSTSATTQTARRHR